MILPVRLLLIWLLPLLAHCMEDYYKLLGISKNADERDLKRAYRKLSKEYHPDKNPGDEAAAQKFVEISDAYDALSQPELRKIYDQYGHEGVKQHRDSGGRNGPGRHDPFDLFSRFFGGHGHFGGHGERRGPNQEVKIAVPLHKFYMGGEVEFQVDKQFICEKCEGSGSRDGKMKTCGQCGGHGVVVQKIMLAPGIFQQAQSQCGHCGGQGKVIEHPCKTCGGSRVVRQTEKFNVPIERGYPKGGRVVMENEADASPDYVAGDLYVVLMEQDPAHVWEDGERTDGTFFRRRDEHLFWREVLSLREAWMGDWSRNITHLDGRTVRVGRRRGQVVQPGAVEVLEGQGMPIFSEDRSDTHGEIVYGALHVEYEVVLPDQMEGGMEKDFWALWDKWRKKKGVDLHKDSGRPEPRAGGSDHDFHNEL